MRRLDDDFWDHDPDDAHWSRHLLVLLLWMAVFFGMTWMGPR